MNLPAEDINNIRLSITRDFNAPRDKVFQAWTDPKLLTQWFGPKGVKTSNAEVDLRVGGTYQLTMEKPDGQIMDQGGTYKEIVPFKKLVFTWVLDGQSCAGSIGQYAETVVTIELEDLGTSTRLILTHDFLPSDESKAAHQMGWEGSLEGLADILV